MSSSPIPLPPYILPHGNWKLLLKDKCVLFDTNAIIAASDCKAGGLIEELATAGSYPAYSHPVYIELLRTEKQVVQAERINFLVTNNFIPFPLSQEEIKIATKLQALLYKLGCRPSPADIYLGAALARHRGDLLYLLTANTKDFPHPVYNREGYIVLQDANHTQVFTLTKLSAETQNSLLSN